MSIPMLMYAPSSQNQRVRGYDIPGEEQPRLFNRSNLLSTQAVDELIYAAYRQVFNEQQLIEYHRQLPLESQLRSGQITVREFIRALVLSDNFRRLIYDCNNNYRVVRICIQRLLGREVYGDREVLSWSIVLATKGLQGFVDAVLGSDEYLEQFGDDIVPYQRRRILSQRALGDFPFARMARYGAEYQPVSQAGIASKSTPQRQGVLGLGKPTPTSSAVANPLLYIGVAMVVFSVIYIAILASI
ncbi:MAG: phycobilisome rod-core linker polypeptide CpcG [Cyanothece sp. SIO2G6]|nr:phycobilisome rod-core linker polypeptide CpcG [Cyanothece sp. SIO2G6]